MKHFYPLSISNEIRSPLYFNISDGQCHNFYMKLSFKYCCLYINHVIVIFLRLVRYLNNNEILFTNVVIDYSHPAKIKSLYDAAQFHNTQLTKKWCSVYKCITHLFSNKLSPIPSIIISFVQYDYVVFTCSLALTHFMTFIDNTESDIMLF